MLPFAYAVRNAIRLATAMSPCQELSGLWRYSIAVRKAVRVHWLHCVRSLIRWLMLAEVVVENSFKVGGFMPANGKMQRSMSSADPFATAGLPRATPQREYSAPQLMAAPDYGYPQDRSRTRRISSPAQHNPYLPAPARMSAIEPDYDQYLPSPLSAGGSDFFAPQKQRTIGW